MNLHNIKTFLAECAGAYIRITYSHKEGWLVELLDDDDALAQDAEAPLLNEALHQLEENLS